MADQAYLAGLLHDIGKLYLLKVIEKLNKTGVARAALEESTLRDVFAELHVEEGGKLMEHWHMPWLYRTVVERHHDEQCNVENLILVLVRLVNGVCRKMSIGIQTTQPSESVHREMALLGLGAEQMVKLESVLDEARSVVI
jgi:HD-like signal output (HDOD) protein